MPDMIGTLGGYDTNARCSIPRVRLWLFFQDPSNRCCTQMQPCPAQRLGNLDLAHTGTKSFQPLHDVTYKVGELVHRFAQLQQCIRTSLINAFHPGCNGGRSQQKCIGRLFQRPTPGGAKLKDRHALIGAVMRTPLRSDLCSAAVLDAEFFSQQSALFVEAIVLRRKPHPALILSAAWARV